MKKIIFFLFCITVILFTNAQEHRDHLEGGNHGEILTPGHDYYVHVDNNTFVDLQGGCNNLTLELDHKSEIIFSNLVVTGNIVVQSINGESHIREHEGTYPTNALYQAKNFEVIHFDNPSTYISLKHISFVVASIGFKGKCGTIAFGQNEHGDPLFVTDMPCIIDPPSVNGGGYMDLVVTKAVAGDLLGGTRLYLVRDCHPLTNQLKEHDQTGNIHYRKGL